ncbi:MAG: hypothetical protein QXZ25_01110 [Candidatus Bathyarchaeia archaeon]
MPPSSTIVLPFAIPAKERSEVFTSAMEVAAILLLAEAKRKKSGLFEASARKTSFISKLHYPLWAIPWEKGSLILDGLGIFSSTIASEALADVTSFIEEVELGASVRRQFWDALEKHKSTFADFAEAFKVKVNALITDKELLSAILEYVKESSQLKTNENPVVILAPPKLDLQTAIEYAGQVQSLHKRNLSDINCLEYAKNLLMETAKLHEQMLLREIEYTREVYEREISKLQPSVDKKLDKLQKEREARIAKMNRVVDNEVKAKERERQKRERELQRLELQIADFTKRRETSAQRHNKIGVARWEHRIRLCENKVREVKKRINALSEFIEKTRKQNEAAIEELKRDYKELIDQEKKKITDIEAQMGGRIEYKQKEIEKLKIATSNIANQIGELINRKRNWLKELQELTMQWHFDDASLLCMPFYLIGYQTGKKTHLHILPPVKVASPKGIIKTLQRTLASLRQTSGVKLLLQPRSKILGKMLDFALKECVKADKAFGEGLRQAAASGNILGRYGLRETLIKGLEELKAEGWISQREGDAIIEVYS